MKNIRFLIIILLIAAAGFGVWYFYGRGATASSGALTTSGTVETSQISISPEISGRITEINVSEGQQVKAGDVLFVLDSALLKAQRNVAAAGLEMAKTAAATGEAAIASAQAQYDMAFNAAMIQNKPARTANWVKTQSGEFDLPLWYYNQAEQINAAKAEADAAQTALTAAQTKLASVQTRATSADFVTAETNLAVAQASYQVANNLYNRVKTGTNIDELTKRQVYLAFRDSMIQSKSADNNLANKKWWTSVSNISLDLRDEAKKIFDDAKTNLDDAQTAYSDAVTTQGAQDVMKARAIVSMAQERYYTALDFERILETGADSPAVTAAQKVLDQAKSGAAQSQSAVGQAQANVDLYDAQIAKTTITAPVDGVILTRAGEPGSVVSPGGVVLVMGRLDDLTITVYVPEDRLGEVSLGQTAVVSVDSFPGQTFEATVTYIADQAEFTPRNVQTVEGRKNTVFAVKLKLADTAGKLKPGMPADITFNK